MRLFQKRILKRLNNKGLTMVELICAVAIVSILGTCISGFMVVGANSYRSGSAETQVQQEAQLVANQIDDLIIDSTASVTFSGGVLTITQGKSQSQVTYNASDKALYYMGYIWDDSAMVYKEIDTNGAQLMAEGVESFNVVTTDFEKNGNIKLEMQISSGSHVYPAYFTITSRNKALSPEEVSYTKKAKVVTNIRKWLLEPNQSYDFYSHASATDKNGDPQDVTWSIVTTVSDADTKFVKNSLDKNSKLQIGKNETKPVIRIKASFTEGEYTAEKYIDVYIRRVNAISLQGLLMPTTPVSKQYKMGAEYKLGTAFDGTSLNQVSGAAYDTAPYAYVDTRTLDITVSSGDKDAVSIYENSGEYYVKLMRDLASGESITIKATSLHAAGTSLDGFNRRTNKTGLPYATVTDEWTITSSILSLPLSWESGFRRGDDSPVHIEYSDVLDFVKEKLNRDTLPPGSTISWFMRFKEEGGDWSIYTLTDQTEFTNFRVTARETSFFKIEKNYQIEFAAIIYAKDSDTIYWPMDENLTKTKSTGEDLTGFEGWTLDGQYSKKTVTAKGEYSATLPIGASRYWFGRNFSLGIFEPTAHAGTLSNPINLYKGYYELNMDDNRTVGLRYKKGHHINLDVPNMQYWNGSAWIEADATQKAAITYTADNEKLKIQNNGNVEGVFRAGVYVTNFDFYKYDSSSTTVRSKLQGVKADSGSEFTKGKAYSFGSSNEGNDSAGVIYFKLINENDPNITYELPDNITVYDCVDASLTCNYDGKITWDTMNPTRVEGGQYNFNIRCCYGVDRDFTNCELEYKVKIEGELTSLTSTSSDLNYELKDGYLILKYNGDITRWTDISWPFTVSGKDLSFVLVE